MVFSDGTMAVRWNDAVALLGYKGTKQASLISLLNESETKEGRTQTQKLGHTEDKLISQEKKGG